MIRRVVVVGLCVVGAGVVLPAQSPDRFEALVGLARVKRDAGDAVAAREYFERARQVQPFDGALRAELFWVVADAAPADAVPIARQLLAERPQAGEIRDRAIAAAVASGDEAAALAFAEAGAATEADRAWWHRRVAESLVRQGRAAAAVAAWERATTRAGAEPSDRAGLALALEASGQYTRATEAWAAVPAAEVQRHDAWRASRMRAVVHAAPVATAAAEAEEWLRAHPDDVTMREMLVELWRRAGRIDLARTALQPLVERADGRRWWRRDVELAREAGDTAGAIARLERLISAGAGTRADRRTLADALIDTNRFDRAAIVLRELAQASDGCDATLLRAMDRLDGATGTVLLIETLNTPACRDEATWIERAVERTTAEGRHVDALVLIERLPAARRATPDLQRLGGQLRLWTGDLRGAAAMLAPVVEQRADDAAAREALVDAHRGLGASYEAWRVALPLMDAVTTPVSRLLMLAELALEADQPAAVDPLLARVPADAASPHVRRALEGRALAALGRPAEAAAVLASIPASERSAATTLTLVDSVYATRGTAAALDTVVASGFYGWAGTGARPDEASVDAPAKDLLARVAMLETLAGSPSAASARRDLAQLDETAPVFVDVEVALAEGRSLDALAALANLPAAADVRRAADLRVTALAGSGNLRAAADALRVLRAERPDFVPFVLREAELAWRLSPGDDTLAAVLALPARFARNRHADVTAARALAFEGRHDDVIAVLGGPTERAQLTTEGRVLMARSLSTLGRATDALAMLNGLDLRGSSAIFGAELVTEVEGQAAGARAFAALATRVDVSADVYRAWATTTSDLNARRIVLENGVRRFPDHAGILTSLAVVSSALGDRAASREVAARAVERDPLSGEAWYLLIANTAADRTPHELDDVLARFASAAASAPALAVATADRVAALVRSASDPVLVAALSWLRAPIDDAELRLSRDLATARLYAAAERWFEALAAADHAVAAHPEAVSALRLRADVLSWAGRHDEGVAAYDEYLALVPGDVDARRQQARVAGWAGRFRDAERLYAALRAAHPDDRVLAAEADAKRAYFRGRWREAVTRYQHWLSLDSENSEARFELSEALRAAGEVERADATLAALAPEGGHRLATAARDRESWRREPTVTAIADVRSAKGYEGQRLVDVRTTGGRVTSVVGERGRATFAADAASVQVGSAGVTRRGYEIGASGGRRTGHSAIDGRVSVWDVAGPGSAVVQASAGGAWSPADRWTLQIGGDRELLTENIATVDQRLMATGPFAAASFQGPHASLEVRSSWQRLSDGNTRSRVSASASHVLSERLDHVRAIVWADLVDFARPADSYFAPAAFLRVDGGLEYTHRFTQPRFRGDRMDQIAIGYLIGTDSRGAWYQHPSVRLAWEMTSSVALSVRGDLIRSRAYNERALTVSLHLIGGAFSR